MIAQARGDRPVGPVRKLWIQVLFADQFLQVREPFRFILLAETVLRVGLEVKKVGADRTVTVLETRQDDAIFHLRHLRTGLDQKAVSRPGRPRRVPDTSGAFTYRTRLEDV